MFYWLIKWIAWPLSRFYFRIQAEGLEHFPRHGPVIVVSNHASFLDAGVLGSALPRKVRFMVLSSMYAMWRFRWFYYGMDTIPVRRGGTDTAAMRQALKVLAEGGVLGVFPEGTRSLSGEVGEALPGAALIAVRSGAPVLPAGIEGAYAAFPPGSLVPRPRKIRVRFGRPFQPPGLEDPRARRAVLEELSGRIMWEIRALVPPGVNGAGAADGQGTR